MAKIKAATKYSMFFYLLVLAPFCSATVTIEPLFCSICDCTSDSTGFYKVNCFTDVKIHLFDRIYWFNEENEEYFYRSLTIENTKIHRMDTQFPTSSISALVIRLCSVDYISDSIFSNLPYLEKLVLSYNEIERLHPKAFVGRYTEKNGYSFLPLKQLFLDHNKINNLAGEIFKYSPYIEVLSLAHNPLQSLSNQIARATTGLSSLRKLDLSYTEISSLPLHFLKKLKKLRYLDFSGNRFLEIPATLQDLPMVKFLHFNDNPIDSLNAFPNMKSLTTLHLCNLPKLQEITNGTFGNLVNLEELHLCDNPLLSTIHREAFLWTNKHKRFWVHIKELYLQNNKLSSLDMELLEWDNLEELDLTGNPWNCDCYNQWMIDDLVPNILLDLDPGKAKELTCAAPSGLSSLDFLDVYENGKMSCWSMHKHFLNWLHDQKSQFFYIEYFIGLLVVIGAAGCLRYTRNP